MWNYKKGELVVSVGNAYQAGYETARKELIKDIKFLIWYTSNPLRKGVSARHDEFERIKKKYEVK